MPNKNNKKSSLLTAGVDEVGRGPLAGPVFAAAVILDPNKPIKGLADSKILTAKQRENLAEKIKDRSLSWAVGFAEVHEIDTINIFQASLLAMQRAVTALAITPQHALIDGKHCPKLLCPTQAIIKGDATVPEISAASILAKVTRDKIMVEQEALYPGYGFAQHKGYSTKMHLTALQALGPCAIHRKSFAPVAELIK